jgi:hypothetical protein
VWAISREQQVALREHDVDRKLTRPFARNRAKSPGNGGPAEVGARIVCGITIT